MNGRLIGSIGVEKEMTETWWKMKMKWKGNQSDMQNESTENKQRLIGNDLFKKGRIHEAFAHYSHSILKAEYNKTSKSKDGKVLILSAPTNLCFSSFYLYSSYDSFY